MSIGDGFFFLTFLKTRATAIKIAKITSPLISTAKPPQTVVNPKSVLSAIVTAVPRSSAMIHGRTPFKNAWTPLYFKKSRITADIKRIMIKDGSTTPSIAHTEPRTPPCVDPTKVAIFTAMGPGVDSATANEDVEDRRKSDGKYGKHDHARRNRQNDTNRKHSFLH